MGAITWGLSPHINEELIEFPRGGKNTEVLDHPRHDFPQQCWAAEKPDVSGGRGDPGL